MVNFSTLSEMLLRRYTVDFINNMQALSHPAGIGLGGTNKPAVPRFVGSTNDGYKGKTLFRERLFDKWSIQSMPEHVKEAELYESVIGHQCHRFGSIYYFSMWPGEDEVCWSCQKPIPEKLIGLWKMQNYDIYTQL